MNTPLYDGLLAHLAKDPAPFHMPGHKGRSVYPDPGVSPAALDLTELPDTGDLYAGGDAIQAAEDLWARAWGFACCQFLTGGSTQGLHAALLLAARRGKDVAVDRCCHRSVYNALGLLDLHPHYLLRRQDRPVDPAALEALLTARPEVKTVCVTSPTYYGVLSDIQTLSEIARAHGALLVVDAAHGAHLPFLGKNPFLGAHIAVASAHKTMAAYGQGALLFSAGAFSRRDLAWAASVCGTSSPSYPILASLDCARARLESPRGRAELDRAAAAAAGLAADFPCLPGGDALRVTLTVNASAATGHQVKALLEDGGVFPEMADRDHVVFLLSGQNTDRDVERLRAGLARAAETWPGVYASGGEPPDLPGVPELCLTPARALTAPRTLRPLDRSVGLVCLQQVAPYPPGVPVIAPGERIEKKGLAYLEEVGYNIHQDVYVSPGKE